MPTQIWKQERKIKLRKRQETTNRDGHWTRHFSVRTDPWILVEAWVLENGYHLTALRGKRRLYQKNFPSGTVILVDIKEHEAQVTLSAWILFGWLSRLGHLFFLPREMNPNPSGLVGSITRRIACRDLNGLLERLHQPAILGSRSFHIADFDPSTLLLTALFLAPLAFYGAGTLPRMEVSPSLLPALYLPWIKRAVALVLLGLILAGAHEFCVSRWLSERWMKTTSMVFLFTAFATLVLFSMRQDDRELFLTESAYHCLQEGDGKACIHLFEGMPSDRRLELLRSLELLDKPIAGRDHPHGAIR